MTVTVEREGNKYVVLVNEGGKRTVYKFSNRKAAEQAAQGIIERNQLAGYLQLTGYLASIDARLASIEDKLGVDPLEGIDR